MSEASVVGKKLVDLCKKGQFAEAINSLYSDDIVSVEAHSPPGKPARVEGIAAVKGKAEWWTNAHEVHKCAVTGPWPHGDRFIVQFDMDVTPKEGPMKGKRMTISEGALYTVKGGKVVHEEFFYDMGG